MIKTICAIAFAVAPSILHARDLGQWNDQPPEVRAWYRNAELTSEARMRLPWVKCCDQADTVETRFRVDRATAGDAWFYLVDGKWKRIPDDIIHWGEHAPGGEAKLFVYHGVETCFFPPDGGI